MQNSSLGDLVTQSLTHSLLLLRYKERPQRPKTMTMTMTKTMMMTMTNDHSHDLTNTLTDNYEWHWTAFAILAMFLSVMTMQYVHLSVNVMQQHLLQMPLMHGNEELIYAWLFSELQCTVFCLVPLQWEDASKFDSQQALQLHLAFLFRNSAAAGATLLFFRLCIFKLVARVIIIV